MNKLSNRTHIHFAPFQLGPFRHNSEQVENVLNVLYDLAYLPNVLARFASQKWRKLEPRNENFRREPKRDDVQRREKGLGNIRWIFQAI